MVFRHLPRRNILNIKNEIDRVYDELFSNRADDVESMGNLVPPVNIEENDDAFIISAELPGLDKKDVKITFKDGSLCLSGKKEKVKEESGKNFHRREMESGTFSRSFSIPNQIKTDKIEANFDRGVLTIHLPKAEEVKPQEIKINVK